MKEIVFNNEQVKNEYERIIKENRGLPGVISSLQNNENIKIIDIMDNDDNSQILIGLEKGLISVTHDKLNKQIRVVDPYQDYTSIYDDYFKLNVEPIFMEYQKGNRIISKKNKTLFEKNVQDTYEYTIKENNSMYEIILIDLLKSFNEENFVNNLINCSTSIDNINMLLVAMKRSIPLNGLNIYVADAIGSIAVFNNGELMQYTEYRDVDNEYQKIYLENNEFFIERKSKEEYDDQNLQYIKRR